MNLAELIADTLFLSNTVTTQYTEDEITRNLNYYYDQAVLDIWRADGVWNFDENGDSDFPIYYGDLVEGQRDYHLPTEARKIHKVEIDYNGSVSRLEAVSRDDIDNESEQREGEPKRYYMVGRSVLLDPIPDKDITDGLYLYLSRSVTPLETGSTPKIESEFHRYLSFGAAMDWLLTKGNISKAREYENRINKIREKMNEFYEDRNADYDAKIKPKRYNYK